MTGRQTARGRTTTPAEPPPAFKDCHEAAQEAALLAAGGDMHRIEVITARDIRIVNPR